MTAMGAFIQPSDMYCHPRTIPDDSVMDWETAPIDKLEAASFRPCQICFGEDAEARNAGGRSE